MAHQGRRPALPGPRLEIVGEQGLADESVVDIERDNRGPAEDLQIAKALLDELWGQLEAQGGNQCRHARRKLAGILPSLEEHLCGTLAQRLKV